MQKLLVFIFALILSVSTVYAETIDKTLNKLGINKSAVSVVVKNISTKDTVYSLNGRTPMHPASTLKLVTTAASVDTLGADYSFKTSLYKSTNNDLYFKLSGDPLLSSKNLDKMVKTARDKKITPKNVYVDDSAFDKVEWGEGWQWDDALNPLMPKFSVYNLNKNLLKIDALPTTNGMPATVSIKPNYPITYMNYATTNLTQTSWLKAEKNPEIANTINILGNVSKAATIYIPLNNPKLNFMLRLADVFKDSKIEYFGKFTNAKLPKTNVYLVDEVQHGILPMLGLIIKNSDNLVAESLFKAAGAEWAEAQGSFENSKKMLDAYFEKLGIDAQDIRIVDGSGVSKNNLMTADFMANFLVYLSEQDGFENIEMLLPTPSEGTLKNRMLYFKDNLRAKTGTLADTSAIAGYITSKRGKTYAFDIMINDAKTSSADKKNIEEQILRSLYMNY
mgnify:CR=1 FL=1